LLRSKIDWFQIPDLVVLLATFAFFCLGVMAAVNPSSLPSDPEAGAMVELVRQRLLAHGIFAVTLAGGISFFRAFDEMYPEHGIYHDNGLYICAFVGAFLMFSGRFGSFSPKLMP
jgi:hypothetical protein